MKWIAFLLLLCPLAAGAQVAMSSYEAEEAGYSLADIDEAYARALTTDPSSVFFSRAGEYGNAYQQMFVDLLTFLSDRNFRWTYKVHCYNKIYFNREGKIDYFFYDFAPGEIGPEKQKQFRMLASEFVKEYRFPLTAPRSFAQCNDVVYQDL